MTLGPASANGKPCRIQEGCDEGTIRALVCPRIDRYRPAYKLRRRWFDWDREFANTVNASSTEFSGELVGFDQRAN